jgi:DNA-binding NarL/FixJ family response regulator
LPGTTGIELATAVKEVFPDCKAILLSAQNALPQMPELARLDGEPLVVLSKTVRAEDLLARVAETLKLPQNNKGAAALSN